MQQNNRRIILCLNICFFLFLLGCGEHWQVLCHVNHEYAKVVETCQSITKIHGYTFADIERPCWESNWQNHLQPLRYNGYRTQLKLCIRPFSSEEANVYQISLQIIRQRNHGQDDYMNENLAIWLSDGYDVEKESSILRCIESKLFLEKR